MLIKKETKKIIQYLRDINDIPRASGDEAAICEYLLKFATDRGLECWKDEKGNFYAKVPAYGECSDEPVILQGHMDMVYVRTDECPFEYEEGIEVLEDEEYVYANGTSLGADNGIAVAYCMALMDSKDVEHPELEIILTVEEEIGLVGAKYADISRFRGKRFINLDAEEEGVFTVSCAGGYRTSMYWDVEKASIDGTFAEIQVVLTGLKGGHSGVFIDAGRANAIQLAGRLLHYMNNNYEYYIGDIFTKGGKENIICKDAKMTLYVKPSDAEQVLRGLKAFISVFENEYSLTDTLEMRVEMTDEKSDASAFPKELNERLTSAILLIPYGVMDFSKSIEGLVETSMNMGAIEYVDGRLHLLSSVRSSVSTRKAFVKDKLQIIGAHYCDDVQFLHEYPEWEYKEDSKLRDVACEAYHTVFGREAKVQAIHAGLECGYFYGKDNELDIISMGPDVYDIHTVNEKISKKSIGRTWVFMKEILHNL